jgi:chromosome partitioning protein
MSTKIVTVAIEKGGSGKTTMAVHLAFFAAESGLRTLLVDLDTQMNATSSVAREPLADRYRVSSELYEPIEPTRPILRVDHNLDLLPADERLHGVERLSFDQAGGFCERLAGIAKEYDFVVVDTPPTASCSTLFPLMASDYVLAPVLPHLYSLSGVQALLTRVDQVRRSSNRSLEFLGLLINNWNRRDAEQTEIVEDFKRNLGEYLVPHEIGASAAVGRLARKRRPVWHNAIWGSQRKAAKDVRAVMSWIIDRTQGRVLASAHAAAWREAV